MNTDDEELKSLLQRLGKGIIVLIIFTILLIIFLVRKFYLNETKLIQDINNKKDIYILVDDNKCSNCEEIKRILKDNSIDYYEINIDKSHDYKDMLSALEITDNEIDTPTILYVSKGKFTSSIVDIKDEDVINKFIENNENNGVDYDE